MSIANISSENRLDGGNPSNFELVMKKPLQKIIGLQLLNATVPLTYSIINEDTDSKGKKHNELYFADSDGSGGFTERIAIIESGTFSADVLAEKIEIAMNAQASSAAFPKIRNQYQRALHIDNRSHRIIISSDNLDRKNIFNSKYYEEVDRSKVSAGMIVGKTGTGNPSNGIYVIKEWNKSTGVGKLNTLDGVTGSYPEPQPGVAFDTKTAGQIYTLVYPGYLVFYDNDEERIFIANGGVVANDPGYVSLAMSTTIFNSRRILKTIGFEGGNIGQDIQETIIAYRDADNDALALAWAQNRNARLGRFMLGENIPEIAGPSLLFLRLSGDIIMDQQNSETHMNDRIPIPIDKPHGGVVHYENDSEADVIPLAVPCDVRRLKIRLEYGDDNEVVGGDTANLRGHELYLRLKFFKMHQQGGKKM